ncbi:MAG: hypothetical protein C5B56_11930, partial [Proteobacteria bacterium]
METGLGADKYTEISECRACGGTAFDEVIDLGTQVLASRFPRPGEPDPPRAPLALIRCRDCGL